jgi:hypothetical protein
MFRLEVLKVDRSEKFPLGSLTVGVYLNTDAGEKPRWTYNLVFRNPDQEKKADVIEISYRLMGPALNTMADLLAPNVAAANRARMQAKHENGPSVDADGPLPSDETPRAARPATTNTHPKARRERDKSQVGFESYGNSSGGAPLPPTEPPDDVRPKRYG